MRKEYFGTTYEWINEEHEEHLTRAYRLFRQGTIMIGHKRRMIEPRDIEIWLKKELIKEVIE